MAKSRSDRASAKSGVETGSGEATRAKAELSRERAFLAQERAGAGFWDIRFDDSCQGGAEIYISPQMKRLAGFADDELPSTRAAWIALIHPEDRERVSREVDGCLGGAGSMLSTEYRIVRKDGAVVWVAARGQLERDAEGRPCCWSGVIWDTTAVRHAEGARAQLAAVAETSFDAIICMDPDGVVLSWNRAAERMFGHTEAEMVGHPVFTTLPAELWHELAAALRRTADGETVRLPVRRFERGDDTVEVEPVLSPIRDERGAVVGVSAIARDVTQTRGVERALAESEAIFRAVGELVPFGAWTCNAAGECTLVTEPFIRATGRSLEELQGFGWLDLVPENEREALTDTWMHSVRSGEDWNYRYNMWGADGRLLAVETRGRPVRGADGEIALWVGFHLDVTHQRELEEELRALTEELEDRVEARTAEAEAQARELHALTAELASTEQREREELARVLHDGLQQMVTAAKIRAKLALDATRDDEARGHLREARALLEEALSESRELVVRLAPPVVQRAGLAAVLRWLAADVEEHFGLVVDLRHEDEPPEVDPIQRRLIFRVVRELVTNVAKHAGVGRAEVRTRAAGGALEVEVDDGGVGFDPENVGGADGKAFGLLSVREQVRSAGGELTIISAPGEGTCVMLRLPLDEAAWRREEVASAGSFDAKVGVERRRCPSADRPVRVLLVDDDGDVRSSLVAAFASELGIEVVGEADSGEHAFELTRELEPDVVLMDVSMVGIGGVEATRLITEDMPRVSVFGLSMHTDRKVVLEMRAAGAAGYFTKDGDEDRLIGAILRARRR